MATQVDLTIEQGASFAWYFSVKSSVDQSAVTITGYAARSQVRTAYADASPLISFSTFVDTANSRVLIALTDAQTAALAATSGGSELYYDVEIDNGTYVYRIAEGRITVTAEVTK